MSKQTCGGCSGTGRCRTCRGNGKGWWESRRDNWAACSGCCGTGKCISCGGRGQR